MQSTALDCNDLVTILCKRPKATSTKAKTARAPFGNDFLKKLPIPEVIHNYNQYMNQVDVGDQLRATMKGRRQQKNWKALFLKGLLTISIVNSYLLSHHSEFEEAKYQSHTQFRKDLAEQLMRGAIRRRPPRVDRVLGKRNRDTSLVHHWC